jgi:hypothetical protein
VYENTCTREISMKMNSKPVLVIVVMMVGLGLLIALNMN